MYFPKLFLEIIEVMKILSNKQGVSKSVSESKLRFLTGTLYFLSI